MSSEKIQLSLDPREATGKKVTALRNEGQVPVVVYGPGFDPINAQADIRLITKVYHAAGRHHPVHLKVNGKQRIAMIKAIDSDPVKGSIRHVSFHAVNQNETVDAEVPIHLIGEGESPAERAGLIVLQTLESIEVTALPLELPDSFDLSMESLEEVGNKLTVADIKLPKGVEITGIEGSHDDIVIASVYEPSALQAANESAGGDAEDEDSVGSDHGDENQGEDTSGEGGGSGAGDTKPVAKDS